MKIVTEAGKLMINKSSSVGVVVNYRAVLNIPGQTIEDKPVQTICVSEQEANKWAQAWFTRLPKETREKATVDIYVRTEAMHKAGVVYVAEPGE